MLLDLSLELLEAIGAQLTQSDCAILRTVSRGLNSAFYRLFFSILVLKTHRNGLNEDGVQMHRTLATGGTGWSVHARTVRMIPAKALSAEGARYDKPVDLLATTLASLSNIQTVMFSVDGTFKITTDFLNTAPTVQNLELNISGTINVSPLQVRSLRKFTLVSSAQGSNRRRCVRRRTGTRPPPAMYQDIVNLISQNLLNSLHMEGTSDWSAIWRMLRSRTEGVRLAEITTNVVTKELFDYLISYSGLEKLTLLSPDGGSLNASNRLADTFFETVLPHHAESLTELSCGAAYETRFSFGIHNVNIVSLLHKLTKLEMSINAGAVRTVSRYQDKEGQWEPIVTFGFALEVEQADIDSVVTLLLKTAAALPALRELVIVPAETEDNRNDWTGNGELNHKPIVDVAIGRAVRAFRTDVPCSAIVYAGSYTYELRALNGLACGESATALGYGRTG
ncbi:hypothetical protein MSAN_01597500 [Mycena sanguinolenta]|uniref:F-box domain-containing protein n=1 Tax=Mycena sanguinolenta TaxID=230812 RepID=A0A8H6Y4B2_9AGAR|nr:hypothetical protein MSAN_01597500 [Mycena sanguinolenta]